MKKNTFQAFLAVLTLAALVSVGGCVTQRPSRNGVFNENQYLRKAFIIQGTPDDDPGWFLKASITAVSTPNPLGANDLQFGIWPGSEGEQYGGAYWVRFAVTQDKLNMINMRSFADISQFPNGAGDTTTLPETVNAWPITNVDLKYQVNLDGEKTNFYQENQELDWQVRQWVKINFAKNDLSDVAPFGPFVNSLLENCTDIGNSSATLYNDPTTGASSFLVDEYNNYMEWTIQITLPINFDDPTCMAAYGGLGTEAQKFGVTDVTFNLKYSMVRADPSPAYATRQLQIAEKDPILHKYGPLYTYTLDRDPSTGLLATRRLVNRYDPQKDGGTPANPTPIVWYFVAGFPDYYKPVFTATGECTAGVCGGTSVGGNPVSCTTNAQCPQGIGVQTNSILKAAGAGIQVAFQDYDQNLDWNQPPREYGDVRYNTLRWSSNYDIQEAFGAVTSPYTDPRTGEVLTTSILYNNPGSLETFAYILDSYLLSVGASANVNSTGEWAPGSYSQCSADADCGGGTGGTTGESCCATGTPGAGCVAPTGGALGNCELPMTCTVGETVPIIPAVLASNHNGQSTLFTKMQQYLGEPQTTYGSLGPQNFVYPQDSDFFNAYYQLAPYWVFADPFSNWYVAPEAQGGVLGPDDYWTDMQNEAQFQAVAAMVNSGQDPYSWQAAGGVGASGSGAFSPELSAGLGFLNNLKALSLQHQTNLNHQAILPNVMGSAMRMDSADPFTLTQIAASDARRCDPTTMQWETKAQWIQRVVDTWWVNTMWHEFGHAMGLDHNFMASIDGRNFPTVALSPVTGLAGRLGDTTDPDLANACPVGGTQPAGCTPRPTLHSSSVMEYNQSADFDTNPGWGPWDQATIYWIYANTSNSDSGQPGAAAAATMMAAGTNPKGISGQYSSTVPWNDKYGFQADGATEIPFLYCNAADLAYTPLCRQGDAGRTPSEITANDLDAYEWNYQYRNFRNFYKIFSFANYPNAVAGFIQDTKKFIPMWVIDWQPGPLQDNMRLIGITPPADSGGPCPAGQMCGTAAEYYQQLTNKFNSEMSASAQIVAAYHEAVIEQGSGERPYATVYDDFYGDVTQQGIILDKLFAMQDFIGLWPITQYNQNYAGAYLANYSLAQDSSYGYVSEEAALAMIGGAYDVYPYFVPLAVMQFAQDTHNPAFGGRIDIRNWVGGFSFTRLQDFLDYWRNLANQYSYPGCEAAFNAPSCTYDPRPLSDNHNRFTGPDSKLWIWAYIPDRNTWVVAQQERNVASYIIVYNYNDDVVYSLDDGSFPGNAYADELPMKYMLDDFEAFN
jgi:hypothetical protein